MGIGTTLPRERLRWHNFPLALFLMMLFAKINAVVHHIPYYLSPINSLHKQQLKFLILTIRKTSSLHNKLEYDLLDLFLHSNLYPTL
jgi:hypothetical protein